MRRIELQCPECGGKEITFVDVSPQDKVVIAALVDTDELLRMCSDQELAMYADELQRGDYPNTHVVCQTCGYLIPIPKGA